MRQADSKEGRGNDPLVRSEIGRGILAIVKRSQEVQRELLKSAEHARTQYERLSQEHSRLLDESCDPALAYPDGAFAIARSLRMHRAARVAFDGYRNAWARYHRLAMGAELP